MANLNSSGKVRGEDERIAVTPFDSKGNPSDGKASQIRDFLLKSAVIVLAGLWIYTPSYHGDWLWDDDQSITANPTTQGPYSLAKFWLAPEGADYFPLTATGFWLQWQFFGMSPTGYHVVNVVLHILGALAFWWLLHVMRVPGAWLGGLVFAVHPICVESVSWVSELKNTLSQPLFFLACGYFVQFSDSDTSSPEAWRKYLLSMAMFLLAMFAKTSVVMFPVVILLYAWWKRGRITVKDIIHSAPFFLISLILGLLTIYYQHGRAIGQEKIIVGDIWTIGGFLQRFAIAGMAIVFYLWKSIWPFDLLPIYPRWEVDPPKIWQFLPWPLLAAAAWWLWNRRGTAERPTWQRDLLFCLGFFVLILVPVLGFVTISYMRITWVADHFLYLPMASIIAFLAAAGMHAYGRLKPAEQPLAVAGCAAVLAILTFSSFRYAHAWANEDALWNHTLATNHEAWQAHNRLGAKKFARGDIDGAFYHFTNSTRLRPDLGETHNNLGTALSAKGRLDEAIKEFAEACRVTPHVPAIHVNLANALAAAGRFAEAAAKYREILTHVPLSAPLWNNYAVSLYKQGANQESVEAFRKAISLDPNLKDAREGLAVALGEKPEPAPAQPPSGAQMPMALPQSPTLGAPPAVGPSSPLFP